MGNPPRRGSGLWTQGGGARSKRHATNCGLSWFTCGAPEQRWPPTPVAYLVGTHHGFGRPFFPDTVLEPDMEEEASGSEDPRALREAGSGWYDLVEGMHSRFGLWGTAYLEALLRCGDRQLGTAIRAPRSGRGGAVRAPVLAAHS